MQQRISRRDRKFENYVLRRLVVLPIQLFGITLGVFVLIRLLPTDPVAQHVGLLATPAAYALARHGLGLDQSLPTQLAKFLGDLSHFSLGTSWQSSSPVTTEIATRFPTTVQLIVMGFSVALLIGLLLGVVAALKPGGRADRLVFVYGLFGGSQPEFWWGLMFIFAFSRQLRIFPAPLGTLSPGVMPPQALTHFILLDSLISGEWATFSNALMHFLLPALTLAFVLTGPIVKMTRQTMVSVLRSEFILHARARGLQRAVVARYALRNALPPIVTLVGILFGYMLGGAVLIEQIFSLNGLGQYALTSTLALDYPSMQGTVLVMAAFALGTYMVIDILYAIIDPRIEL
jgi:ABC-type dipeptide/oligopeptide/nickel transport system permease component